MQNFTDDAVLLLSGARPERQITSIRVNSENSVSYSQRGVSFEIKRLKENLFVLEREGEEVFNAPDVYAISDFIFA